MPRISVVVPIHDVEEYLAACLQSLARQTFRDLDVVLVDDGSTDGSAEIAERFCVSDRRFRLISQPNGGLGRARNVGVAHATGEFLAFADSDDLLVPDAYERLLGALDRSGSDFASGNVHRFTSRGAAQAAFLAPTFARTRLRSHVTRFRPLLADRTAWNKLWRRAFWDAHALRFPEGVLHEDIPVTVPAHFRATSVDVLAEPVYLYRTREAGARSITQRRLEPRVLRDRFAAVEHVSAYLRADGPRGAKRWYDERVVGDDLLLHLDLFDEASAEYRAVFMQRANAYLDRAAPGPYEGLPAIDRLKWRLVERGLSDELAEVVRFGKERAADTAPVRRRGRWYGDYPFHGDRRVSIPRSTYRLGRHDRELALTVHLEELRRDGDRIVLRGHGALNGLPVGARAAQHLDLRLVPEGAWRAGRMRVASRRLTVAPVHRSDLAGAGRDLSWSGFEATLSAADLGGALLRGDASWRLCAHARARSVSRYRTRFVIADPDRVRAQHLLVDGAAIVAAVPTVDGAVTIRAATRFAWIGARDLRGAGTLVLCGIMRDPHAAGGRTLELSRQSDGRTLAYPLTVEGAEPARWSARLPLREVGGAAPPLQALASPGPDPLDVWDLVIAAGDQRLPVALPDDSHGAGWPVGPNRLTLAATAQGDAALVVEHAARVAASRRSPERSGRSLVTLSADPLAAGDWDV